MVLVSEDEVELVALDRAPVASVRSRADSLDFRAERVDGIIANAGVMTDPKVETIDGFEDRLGTNYLEHFVLVNGIAGQLTPGGRGVRSLPQAAAVLTSIASSCLRTLRNGNHPV